MKMTQLLYFKTVAETGTIGDAAKKLGVTASAVSISISKLEQELGACLFEHKCNRIVLNNAGRYYLGTVNRVFAHLEDATKVLQGGWSVNDTRTTEAISDQSPPEDACVIM